MIRFFDANNSDPQSHGFHHAKMLMTGHNARVRTHHAFEAHTSALNDFTMMAAYVHLERRFDRAEITFFDHTGAIASADTMYFDDFTERLEITPDFDHVYTNMEIPENSDLAQLSVSYPNWLVDLNKLRQYKPAHDLRRTRRRMFLSLAKDLVLSGEITASGFLGEQAG